MECRARFLQLRLKELAAQEEHYKAELQKLQQQEQQLPAEAAPSAPQSAQPADMPVGVQQEPAAPQAPALAPEPELKQEPAGDGGIFSKTQLSPWQPGSAQAAQPLLNGSSSVAEQAAGPRRSQRRRKQERLHAPDLVPSSLLRHPMFAALAGVRNSAKVRIQPLRTSCCLIWLLQTLAAVARCCKDQLHTYVHAMVTACKRLPEQSAFCIMQAAVVSCAL